ncbi:MAG: nicotinamide-nucleotide amidohydrolase family protein [Clostridia bacterium]|nr:nicotinamide-nucleotide amidohydrolase family protein [Clostridia bacterium]
MTKENKELWTEVVNKMIKKKLTISTMESCTGGGIANAITNIPGASSIIEESYVTYSNDAKVKQGVRKQTIDKYSVYSEQTAISMAKALRRKTGSDIAIGVTGQLGRLDPKNKSNTLNTVWYAIIFNVDDVFCSMVKVSDDERENQKEEVLLSIANSLNSILNLKKK